ncbi:Thiamine-monophosphate kinase [Methanosarcina siciliae C2J]|uniref:Thiamine-monophosphate kinase n=1 Tax=Methanosarcina siciliae C2J TaxID=1434118 RepID=A0A0E3PUA9_9EURY|nr:thiamine-phosphate kinase [Methanosarcina siciliae]AKB38967.1 Thiamine-monophosphate kinase [Methanosarcina siciliae C2J]
MKGTKVYSIGERALISRLSEIFNTPEGKERGQEGILVGAGSDDCAVLDLKGEDCLVVTTDMLHRTTDFPPEMTPWQMGWMSAAVNLSDIAAMGAEPTGLLMAIGMPADTEIAFAEELAKGIQACAEFCETAVIGGDLDTHAELTITGTALGRVKKSRLLLRKGAKPGDLVCVTGYTGSAGVALEAIQSKKSVSETVLKALFEPVPRTREARKLAETGAVTSMMDTSDGLAMSLYDLARQSKVGFRIREEALPILQEVREFASDPGELLEFALYTGGDFELIFTVDPGRLKKVQNICNLTIIGECTKYDTGIVLESPECRLTNIEQRGYLQLKAENS